MYQVCNQETSQQREARLHRMSDCQSERLAVESIEEREDLVQRMSERQSEHKHKTCATAAAVRELRQRASAPVCMLSCGLTILVIGLPQAYLYIAW